MADFQTCNLSPSDVSQLVTEQLPKIYLETLMAINTESPWTQIIPSSTTDANMGSTIESTVTPRQVDNQNQVEPEFTDYFAACTMEPTEAQMGNIRFSTQLEILRGVTQPICLYSNWDTVYGALAQNIEALKSELKILFSNDTRAKLVRYSGVKASVQVGVAPQDSISGDEWQVEAAWPALPDANITFAWLKGLYNFMLEEFTVNRFGSGADAHAKFIASSATIDRFRNEAGPNNVLIASTTGGYSEGKNGLWDYLWIDSNFRGIKFSVDQYPLRFNEVDVDGYPIWIAPRVKVAVTASNSGTGFRLARNPAWTSAAYEVAVLVFKDSFRRRVPQQWVAQGDIKFASQNFGGDLQWVFRPDNGCNVFSDKGFFTYQFARAYQAIMPHGILAISYARCGTDYGLTECSSS